MISTYISYFPLRQGHGIGAFNAASLEDARAYAAMKGDRGSRVELLSTYNARHADTGISEKKAIEHDDVVSSLFD